MTATNEGNADDAVECTKCGSTQVHAEKRGWRLATGFFGSGKIVLTCLKCCHTFKPGQERVQARDDVVLLWVFGVFAAIIAVLWLVKLLVY
jgi:hypothetical protein